MDPSSFYLIFSADLGALILAQLYFRLSLVLKCLIIHNLGGAQTSFYKAGHAPITWKSKLVMSGQGINTSNPIAEPV